MGCSRSGIGLRFASLYQATIPAKFSYTNTEENPWGVFLHEHRREPVGHKWPLGSCLKPLILLCAGFCNCPRQQTTMAAKLSKAWHSDRRCFTRSCTPETRSLQFEVCKLGRSDNQCTVRLSKALSQKASSSLEAPLHQVPQTEAKAIRLGSIGASISNSTVVRHKAVAEVSKVGNYRRG